MANPSLINTLLGDGLQIFAAAVTANESAILARAKALNVTAEQAADAFIDSIKVSGVVAIVAPELKSSLKSAIDNAISDGAITEEQAVLNLIIAAAQNEAKKLLGA